MLQVPDISEAVNEYIWSVKYHEGNLPKSSGITYIITLLNFKILTGRPHSRLPHP